MKELEPEKDAPAPGDWPWTGGLLFKMGQWRRSRWFLLAVGAGVLMLLLSNWLRGASTFGPRAPNLSPGPPPPTAEVPAPSSLSQVESELAAALTNQLSQVAGAGRVSVTVSLARGVEQVWAEDKERISRTTDERDARGGGRTVTETSETAQLLWQQALGGGRAPVELTQRAPRIRGVLIVASGAADPRVRADLLRGVQVLLDLPLHRIAVITGGDG